jgi:membrane-associated phospholipid phosphatase
MLQTADITRPDRDPLRPWRWATLVIFPLYLGVTHLTIGLRVEHVVMSAAFIVLALVGPRLRRLSFRALPFFLTGVAYDNQRFFKHLRGTIHTGDLYEAERRLFGVTTASGRVTLPELLATRTHPVLDFVCGLAYLVYVFQYIGITFYLFFRDEPRMSRMAWGFLLINLLGMATYLLYPAAPPWYIMEHGTGPAIEGVAASAAGAARFDALLGITYFQHFYARSTNVFGAMPSLHAAYPALATLVTATRGRAWLVGTGLFALLVAFSALYLQHHYLLDVLLGIAYAGAVHGMLALAPRLRAALSRALARPVPEGEVS